MIFQELRKHKLDYSLLAVMALVFTVYFMIMRHYPSRLLLSTITFASLYVIWGAWHHNRSHHLTIRIVLEYFLVAVLGIIIVSTLLI